MRDTHSVKAGETGLETACILLGNRSIKKQDEEWREDLSGDPRHTDKEIGIENSRKKWTRRSAFHLISLIQGTDIPLFFDLGNAGKAWPVITCFAVSCVRSGQKLVAGHNDKSGIPATLARIPENPPYLARTLVIVQVVEVQPGLKPLQGELHPLRMSSLRALVAGSVLWSLRYGIHGMVACFSSFWYPWPLVPLA